MKVMPIKGTHGLNALKGLSALLLGYFLLALPGKLDCDDFESFFASFKNKTENEKEKILRSAILFVRIENLEVEAMASFVQDKNGVPYISASIKNMLLPDLIDVVVAVCLEIGKIDITLISEDEKKKSLSSRLISGGSS